MEYLYVIIAGFAGYVFGAVWYGVLGKPWMAAIACCSASVSVLSSTWLRRRACPACVATRVERRSALPDGRPVPPPTPGAFGLRPGCR